MTHWKKRGKAASDEPDSHTNPPGRPKRPEVVKGNINMSNYNKAYVKATTVVVTLSGFVALVGAGHKWR